MRKSTLLATLLMLALPLCARAQESAATKPSFTAMAKETRKLTITKIDKASRVVTLKNSKGDTMSVQCGDEVKNFAQLKVNDVVTTTYTESLTIHVEAGGEASSSTETMSSQAKPGEKPSASVMDRTTMKAKITAIDKEKGTVTLHTMSGETFPVTADDKSNLENIHVGDAVVATYTVGQAISVSSPKPKSSTTTKTASTKTK